GEDGGVGAGAGGEVGGQAELFPLAVGECNAALDAGACEGLAGLELHLAEREQASGDGVGGGRRADGPGGGGPDGGVEGSAAELFGELRGELKVAAGGDG